MSCNFRLAGIEPNQRIYAIANYVKGAAQCHYLGKLHKLATETKYSEDELKRRFKNGLKGQTKRDIHIKQDNLKTLTDMMQLAAKLEQNCVISKKDTNRVNYTNGGYKKGRNHNKT